MKAAWSEKGRERKGIYTDHKLKYDKGKCQAGRDILILVELYLYLCEQRTLFFSFLKLKYKIAPDFLETSYSDYTKLSIQG